MTSKSSNKPGIMQKQKPANKTHLGPSSSYKLDSTKTILNGLILMPNFYGAEPTNRRASASSDNENDTSLNNELDFHPPVPHSTATLLSMAEEKIKAMSNFANNSKRATVVAANRNKAAKFSQQQQQQRTIIQEKGNASNKVKSLPPNDNNVTSTDPLKWLRGEQAAAAASRKRSTSRPRNSKPTTSPSNKLKDIFGPEEPDKLITIGGYIINIEKGLPPQMSTSVRPCVSSNEKGVEIEVRIKEVDPTKIVVEKRYNSILVIGVKESGVKPPRDALPMSDTSLPFGFEDDIIEVVNIFAPRDVSLARVMVTPADSKGRLFIKAP